ncbi:MAG: gamma-glutamylcyclotransferase, partial [Oceanipulchritudo sp.]
MDPGHKGNLDRCEGLGLGYRQDFLDVQVNGQTHKVFVYRANPSHIDSLLHPMDWYKALVIEGARFHGFPGEYIRGLEQMPSVPDPDKKRARLNRDLIARIRDHPSSPSVLPVPTDGIPLSGGVPAGAMGRSCVATSSSGGGKLPRAVL